jgi:transposase
MDVPQCPGCRERDARIAKQEARIVAQEARIAELERRLAELDVRLGVNSSNSSVPPSANPLGAPKPVIKKKSGRKRGGQPGHPPHLRELLPPERIARFKKFIPKECESCHASLSTEPGPSDPEPTRFQTIELAEMPTEVVEYQGHGRTCPGCGHLTQMVVPPEIRAHPVGPRLTAALACLAGAQGVSKRGVEEIAADVLKAPISLGKISNMEQEVSAALEAPHQEALQAVRDADVKHADETSWKRAGKLCWLWVGAMSAVPKA